LPPMPHTCISGCYSFQMRRGSLKADAGQTHCKAAALKKMGTCAFPEFVSRRWSTLPSSNPYQRPAVSVWFTWSDSTTAHAWLHGPRNDTAGCLTHSDCRPGSIMCVNKTSVTLRHKSKHRASPSHTGILPITRTCSACQ
jgi:hypothetical protein